MATGYRIVRHSSPTHPDWVDYSSTNPDVEGDVITEPNTTVGEQFWVWSDFQMLAFFCTFSSYYNAEPLPLSQKRLLIVDYDEGNVLDTVLVRPSPTSSRRPDAPVDPYRQLVSGGDMLEEFTLGETAGLASLAPTEPSSGMPKYLEVVPFARDPYGWVEILAEHGITA